MQRNLLKRQSSDIFLTDLTEANSVTVDLLASESTGMEMSTRHGKKEWRAT